MGIRIGLEIKIAYCNLQLGIRFGNLAWGLGLDNRDRGSGLVIRIGDKDWGLGWVSGLSIRDRD